jgi:timeless
MNSSYSNNSRSSFGAATYVMCNAKGIGENQLICHRPLQNLNSMEFDREKRRFRRPKNRAPVQNDLDDGQNHHSALGIRLFLREFCLAFLDNCYNILMPRARVSFIFF